MSTNFLNRINGLLGYPASQGLSLFLLSSALTVLYSSSYRPLSILKTLFTRRGGGSTARKASLLNSTAAVAGPGESESAVRRRSEWLKRDGEHEFLKDVLGDRAIDWVKSRNQHSLEFIGEPKENAMYETVLSILDSDDKIPFLRKINDDYYNFWQDKTHTRGILRRTSLQSYKSTAAATVWETVLDLDALGAAEGESWVFKGYSCYEPPITTTSTATDCSSSGGRERITRALLRLSRGGSDAVVVREFDLDSKQFVAAADGGFCIPEAKSRVSWLTRDLLLVGTDLKDGNSLTDSGYPRVMREWRRGTALANNSSSDSSSGAPIVFEGEKSDVAVHMYICKHREHRYILRGRAITFYTSTNEVFLPHPTINNNNNNNNNNSYFANGAWYQLKVQEDAEVGVYADQLLLQLRSDWNHRGSVFPRGALLAASIEKFARDPQSAEFQLLFTPTATASLTQYAETKDYLVLELLDTVKSRYVFWKYAGEGSWLHCGQEKAAVIRGSSLYAVDSDYSNDYWFSSSSFLQPTTLAIGNVELGPDGIAKSEPLKSLPAQFDASALVEEQFTATSADGTAVPYFLVRHRQMPFDGSTPTLLYGYGGFEISLTPSYSSVVGATWLTNNISSSSGSSSSETGGKASGAESTSFACYVMANIRGGGEFGPAWHQAALKQNRNLAYDDFIAVAEDLIKRNITSSKRLGIRGGSNGGLLMGNMMVRRPDLFGAVCCAVPLLDMKCFHTLLAGASWTAEYGDPEKDEEWSYLQRYSAYHNIDKEAVAAQRYPPLLMTTSTRDDRVHPYHARSFVHRLLDCQQQQQQQQQQVYYYENMEGGHGGAADNKQQAFMSVLYLEFLKKTIGSA